MTCQEARDLFSARADGALSPDEQAGLHAHLATCAECQREWARFERTVALLQAIEPAHAPAGFVDRVVAARPRPWYARLARGLFLPWPVKLPVEAAAILLVAGLAIVVFQRSPELQNASSLREQSTPPATAPSEKADTRHNFIESAPAESPAGTKSRMDTSTSPSGASSTLESARPATEPPPAPTIAKPPLVAAESPATSQDAPGVSLRKEAELSRDTLARRKAAAAAPSPAAPAPSSQALLAPSPEARSTERQAAVESQGATQGLINTEAGLQARLTVDDRAAAEPKVRDLVSRAEGRVVSQLGDGDATVLVVSVPADRWDALRRSLETLGPLRVTGQKVESAGRLLITLRLGR